jgi:hypothetical protein
MQIQSNQTLLDFTLNCSGSIENIWAIAQANNISISSMPGTGSSPIVPANIISSINTLHYFSQNNICIGTRGGLLQKGIGYWHIGSDFIIS